MLTLDTYSDQVTAYISHDGALLDMTDMAPSSKKTMIPLPAATYVLVEIPAPYVLLVTMDLEAQMNALPMEAVWEMDRIWRWFDNEPEL